MKDQLKNYLKFSLVFLFFAFSSCEKDLYQENIKQKHNSRTEILTGKEAEKVASRLNSFLSSRISTNNDAFSKTITLDIGNISYDEILKIIDSYGKENYTFEIIYPEKSYKKFANLILQEKENHTTVKIIEYEMTEEYALQYKLGADLSQFKGIIKVLPIDSDAPCPEPQLIIQIGTIPPNCTGCGGGSNNNGNIHEVPGGIATNPGGSGYSDAFVGSVKGDDSDGDGEPDDDDETGEWDSNTDWHSKLSIDPIIPTDPTVPTDPCPKETQIAILDPVDDCSKSFLQDLNQDERQYLLDKTQDYNNIMEFIKNNPNCENANEIAGTILSDLISGGEFDPKNDLLLDQSIINNQKVKCIFVKLIGQNQSFFSNVISNSFFSNKTAFLKFEIATTPPVSGGVYNAITNTYYGTSADSHTKITLDTNFVNNASAIEIAFTIIHETIHAEILQRCIKLGLIEWVHGTSVKFFNNPVVYTDQNAIFQQLILAYKNYNGGNTQWNHDLFTVFNLREKMENDLINIHQYLNDPSNDFLTAVQNDPNIQGGTYTLQQLMYYTSWIGLEDTQNYQAIFNNPTSTTSAMEQTRINYTESVIHTKYNLNCTN